MSDSPLSLIFHRLKPQIEELHEVGVRKSHSEYFAAVRVKKPTLLDFLVYPINRHLSITPEQHQEVIQALCNPEGPKFNHHGIYQMPDLAVMDARRKFVTTLNKEWPEILREPEPKQQDLSDASLYAYSHTTLLAIKYFWLYLRYPNHKYQGLPAQTEPVRRAMRLLWGSDFKSYSASKTFFTKLSQEVGMSEIDINSALWLIGQKMA